MNNCISVSFKWIHEAMQNEALMSTFFFWNSFLYFTLK